MPFKTGDLEIDNQFAGSLAKNLERFQILTRCFLKFAQNEKIPAINEYSSTVIDGPIFNANGQFIAYFLIGPSRFNFSTSYLERKLFFKVLMQIRENMLENEIIPRWNVNVVEAAIILLTIGYSFDYSIHVAVAFKMMHG
ncbi:unnamed protein product [Dracunculus medinensis]|uniref:Uncharacterized protein n=1 Tax=Dracunculus medinensis TaxID=318479 RepID=A0A0N4UMU8_DRAME|nr:unnamed protein product [Dracunculus medinensis]